VRRRADFAKLTVPDHPGCHRQIIRLDRFPYTDRNGLALTDVSVLCFAALDWKSMSREGAKLLRLQYGSVI